MKTDQPPKLTSEQLKAICPDYENIQEIDFGGFKTVYKASKGSELEVIKVVGIPKCDESNEGDRFREECIGRVQREVEILNRCSTPFLVKTASLPLTRHTIEGFDYVAYSEEYLPGSDLWSLLRIAPTHPDEAEVKLLMKCLLQAIKQLWSLKYVHRDIKPRNVMKLNHPQRPFVLIDLGIAFALLESGLTHNPAHVPATFRYMAPEMADPNFRHSLDYRADLYTTALTVFEYSTGQHPIARDSDDAIRTVSRAIRDPARPLQDLRPDFSLEFCSLIDQLLKKKPALRPANIDRLIALTEI